jgi:hypothetical protein
MRRAGVREITRVGLGAWAIGGGGWEFGWGPVDRGEIPPGTKTDLALDLLYGPLYHRLLHGHASLDDRFAQEVVDAALAGLTTVETM